MQMLKELLHHRQLSQSEASDLLGQMADGIYNAAQIAALLTVYNMRRPSLSELKGFRQALLERCIEVDLSAYNPIDLCGTGGDGKNTFNISTLASFVVAGYGIPVAKHGNYSVSSSCGSSDVMAYFGYAFTNDRDVLKKQIDQCGITFIHAPLFHPAMKEVAPIRRDLKVPTFFNWLGPLVNPSRPKRQVTGVFSLELQRYYKYILQEDAIDFAVVHALDGYDELSLTGKARIVQHQRDYDLMANDFGIDQLTIPSLYGGETVEEAASIFLSVLSGTGTKAQVDVVAANAALAIHVCQPEVTLRNAFELSHEILSNGTALSVFKKLIQT